ncbi:Stp1/IreP family PP2C-type Ser/Thr phosphatase [Lactiplantibacillus mudanjiangensis]|uniref:protein-serine/threonine phosphatase n=1 Tax=Lactiplantibacillus mudanjiangensis TaxID=1296538 RepID=A0A660E256_9LACO|nr:Stp1/IreP family PP2C-type Ser/Thr phosphatase [Lactiplantibacillus mudanjiangensis]VDG19801.1 Stp1/IreP family PP2C-type Ser/Thr phosphatase [Lactobacillus sp.] [Lactiplantibacillus mudanjiangensis]VDG24518.1 Stp1/IreP family PP2C-type Ser/Thr phosphatase [Lactobacillus sp.] [Lactiplantibacillus mudanjiangensis]VDG29809.1 Stp1/IreP family PP2C-type Ser/Thr phosphatase [Lactobacillus sp.] [Lactiplantibacillus mudanjiangensis]VDG31227.1 Stp1/IreP family PP2C-type Ser/Thr phosphatase [Lactobac
MDFAYRSDIGQQRQENEDYVGVFKNTAGINFAVVADGIGGHQGGDVASEMAVSHMGYRFENTTFSEPTDAVKWLAAEVQDENQHIIEKAREFSDLKGMGTTMVAALMFNNEFLMANIGDSRGYLFRDGHLQQLTEDHSLVNELVKRGEISAEQARQHPQKNIITRTLGISPDADIDTNLYQMQTGDQLLLCSDGLTNMVTDDQLTAVLKTDQPVADKCAALIKLANNAGGFDNITALIVAVDGEEAHQ